MPHITHFIVWALTHALNSSVPSGAILPVPMNSVGTEPWHYLYGTVKSKTTAYKIKERFDYYYSKHGYTQEEYDEITKDWKPTEWATDCQGLLDAYMTYEVGDKTDINADTNYRMWCTGKGKIDSIDRDFVIGEAVFVMGSSGKMNHIGWICGFDEDGEPLVIEAQGIRRGVVVNKLSDRPNFTYRGLMTVKFDYSVEPVVYNKVSASSEHRIAFAMMQRALNAGGYTDNQGNILKVDGDWKNKSVSAYMKMLENNIETEPIKTITVDVGYGSLHFVGDISVSHD